MKIQGLKVWLEPDPRIPALLVLRYEAVEVPIKDVLLKGIHPESAMGISGDWCQAAELLANRLNDPAVRYDELTIHRLNSEIAPVRTNGQHYDRRSALKRTLELVSLNVCFADDMSFDRIVGLAREHLRKHWNDDYAWKMLNCGRSGFRELRAFLKQKHPRLKIASYEDMQCLSLSNLLSIDDFKSEEQSLVRIGLARHNLRKTSALWGLTDEDHRMRFIPRIEWLELIINPSRSVGSGHVKYACGLKDGAVHFSPELTDDTLQRDFAKKFAKRHRGTGGDYCFSVPVSKVQEILDRENVSVRFANVRYLQGVTVTSAAARLRREQITRYGIAWRKMETGDEFRAALRSHGWKVSGSKGALIKRTAQLAAACYAEVAPLLGEWFATHRYVRVPTEQRLPAPFPLLEDEPLKNLLLSMFLLRHLRGNTVVDVDHENQSVLPEDMAEALLNGKVSLSGCFLELSTREA